MTSLRQRVTEDMQVRNLAPNTQKSYVHKISLFAATSVSLQKFWFLSTFAPIRSISRMKRTGFRFHHHCCIRSPLSLQSHTA